MACVGFAWAAWINLIDFVVRRLAESVSISGADCDFWSGLNKPQEAQARFARARLCLPYNEGRKETLRPQ
jgi:hypothetical protein